MSKADNDFFTAGLSGVLSGGSERNIQTNMQDGQVCDFYKTTQTHGTTGQVLQKS